MGPRDEDYNDDVLYDPNSAEEDYAQEHGYDDNDELDGLNSTGII